MHRPTAVIGGDGEGAEVITLAQDAARLRAMAEEVAEIAKRIELHVKSLTRDDKAYNTHGMLGGCWGNLERSAGWIDELDRELQLARKERYGELL